jgi:flagellar motility protein MotE (MotC chaperone)
MIRFWREFRLIPIVLVATTALLALKTIGLLVDGRYALTGDPDITGSVAPPEPAAAAEPKPSGGKQSWAQEMFNFPDVTGSVAPPKTADKAAPPATKDKSTKPEEPPKTTAGWTPVPLDGARRPSPAEQALLERLHERRAELDARARDIDMRESLLKAAEKRVESRVAELKDLEARIATAAQQKEEEETARLKNLVTMYENMKAKDAAKIFDRLDMKVLLEVAIRINPRRMSDILAQMSPEAAERLTVALAARSAAKEAPKNAPAELPKIEGKPAN